MNRIVPLESVSAKHGGKAAGLRRLTEIGIRVPSGVALDTSSLNAIFSGSQALRRELATWLDGIAGLVAIRSSALDEDGQTLSFAGIYKTVLSVEPNIDRVLDAMIEVASSGTSARAQSYSGRTEQLIPVIVQAQVHASVAGVAFTQAVGARGEPCAYVEWVKGLGESLVSGRGLPGSLTVAWDALGDRLERENVQIGRKAMGPRAVSGLLTFIEAAASNDRKGLDLEWAIDRHGRIWGLQSRPATQDVLVPGWGISGGPLPASPGFAKGRARFVDDETHGRVEEGEILIAQITEIDYVPAMRRAAAIVTEEGGLLSHAAIVARELGKPCVVGAAGALSLLREGAVTEVDGATGLVSQGEIALGGSLHREIDWASVYVYDRGFEIECEGIPAYAEPTLEGLVVYVDDQLALGDAARVEADVRRRFKTPATIRVGDRRIWFREWRRFNQLHTISYIDSLFRAAIAAWDVNDLKIATRALRETALIAVAGPGHHPEECVFRGEVGAGLHALVAVEVEGYAAWSSYRDSMPWRLRTGASFSDLVGARAVGDPLVDRIVECLRFLQSVRNEAYNFFSENRVFDKAYFPGRAESVARATGQSGGPVKEEEMLLELYASDIFRAADRSLAQQAQRLHERLSRIARTSTMASHTGSDSA